MSPSDDLCARFEEMQVSVHPVQGQMCRRSSHFVFATCCSQHDLPVHQDCDSHTCHCMLHFTQLAGSPGILWRNHCSAQMLCNWPAAASVVPGQVNLPLCVLHQVQQLFFQFCWEHLCMLVSPRQVKSSRVHWCCCCVQEIDFEGAG